MGVDIAGLGELATSVKEPILKLIDVIHDGIGKVYEPTHIVRMAKAHAKEIEIISSVIRENNDLPIAYSKEGTEIDAKSGEELAKRTQNRLLYQEMQKQLNIEMTVAHTYEVLEGEETVTKEPVDKDWTTRFFSIIGDISNEDMQVLWSRILAGEIEQPGSYSLRTLELLRNLSKEEAQIFCKVSNYVIKSGSTCFIATENSILDNNVLSFEDFFLLDEVGLLNLEELSFYLDFTDSQSMELLEYQDNVIIAQNKDSTPKRATLSCHVLTKCGIELYSITEKHFQEDYFKNTLQALKQQNLSVSYSKVIGYDARTCLKTKVCTYSKF